MDVKKRIHKFSCSRLVIGALIVSLAGIVSVLAEGSPAKKKARKEPASAEDVRKANEEVARANARAQRAEEAAAAAQAEASKAKAETEALNRNVSSMNSRVSELEGKLNRALAALEQQQQKDRTTEQKLTEAVTQVSAVTAEAKKAQASVEAIKKETQGAVTSANAKMSFYGFVVANTSFASSQLNIPDIPVWAVAREARLAPPPLSGQAVPGTLRAGDIRDTTLTARQTRLGFRASMPKVGDWTPSAQAEIDFFGARPASGQGTVFNQPRIRLAYVTVEHPSGLKLVAGQDWMIFAPLNPTSFAHFAIPQAASAGNPWMRLPQVRVDKTFKYSEGTSLLVQGGVLRPVSGVDTPAAGSLADLPSLAGERSGHPFYQARIAITAPFVASKSLTLGVSGHYGRIDTGPNTVDSWGEAIDYVVPLHAKVGLSGELWVGSNLAPFQAGIAQGVALVNNNHFNKIGAGGGWAQLAITPTTKWSVNLGYGQDAPKNRHLVAPVNRSKNQIIWTNIMYKIHPNVTMALEYNFFDTIFKVPPTNPARVGTSNYVNLAFVYGF